MTWTVTIHQKVRKECRALPRAVQERLAFLVQEIVVLGPVRGNWPNYSKLSRPGEHHCHLKKGSPTYVAVWCEVAGKIQIVEVIYVGTHANAPY